MNDLVREATRQYDMRIAGAEQIDKDGDVFLLTAPDGKRRFLKIYDEDRGTDSLNSPKKPALKRPHRDRTYMGQIIGRIRQGVDVHQTIKKPEYDLMKMGAERIARCMDALGLRLFPI